MTNLDWTLFHWINGAAGQHDWLDDLAQSLAQRLAIAIIVTLVVGWLLSAGTHLWRERELPRALVACVCIVGVSLGLALLANQVVGDFWFRDRPYTAHPRAHLLVDPSSDPSFASDHATAGFAIAFGAAAALPRVAVLILLQTVLLSLARVYVGLHYPGDVLGGLALGLGATLVASWLVKRGGGVIDWLAALVNGYAARHGWSLRVG